jgi:hypothetical protein
MLKWGAYTLVFGFFIHADNVAHAAGFVAGGVLGYVFRPETLAHTKTAPASVVMGTAGAVSGAVACFLALFPPASSRALAAEMTREREEAQAAELEPDSELDFARWNEACDLFAKGETDDALARVGYDERHPRSESADRTKMLQSICASLSDLRARCKKYEASGDLAAFYDGARLPDEGEPRALVVAAVREQCAALAPRAPEPSATTAR